EYLLLGYILSGTKVHNQFLILVAIIMVAGLTTKTMAQSSVSTNATGEIVTAITLAKTSDLAFGKMAVPSGDAVVTVSYAGDRTALPLANVNLISSTYNAAGYHVTGSGSYTYGIQIASSTIIHSGLNSMTVDNFISSIGTTGQLSSGAQDFTVGADLHLTSGQAVGQYLGTYNVTVAYN
ncbi:MAG: DUF4402 domain-containing protein, partial [Bacteroidota bacterium]